MRAQEALLKEERDREAAWFSRCTAEIEQLEQLKEAKRTRHDRIALLAYHHFRARHCQHGRDLDDWLAAEREIDAPYCKILL